MKTFRLIGMAFIAILMCVNFASCSSDDDETKVNEAAFEGTWYLYSERWCGYNSDGTPTMDFSPTKNYPYHSDVRVWTITKNSNGNYTLRESENNGWPDIDELELIKKNTYKLGIDLFTIKKLTGKEMVLEYIDNYFDFFDKDGNLVKIDPYGMVEELEFGYYSFTR